jgi:hypothetical protein
LNRKMQTTPQLLIEAKIFVLHPQARDGRALAWFASSPIIKAGAGWLLEDE